MGWVQFMKNFTVSASVLVVDDHRAHGEGLAEILSLHGFQTKFAATGTEGLRLVAEWKPDAVLTDLSLPDINGYEICHRIRLNPEWDRVAVILHTGSQRLPGYGEACDAFLTYPIATSDLINVIRGSIMRRRKG